ncbi:MAG: hypothetical protein ICV73_04160 [Acetobacteraceae bacterium]|nr:hypothetical protein [Acetobacteraceae bacterium]
MPSDEAGGQTGAGWTPDEKGQGSPGGASGGGNPGEAGDAKSKGRPTDDRAKMEEAAAETQKESGEGQPS